MKVKRILLLLFVLFLAGCHNKDNDNNLDSVVSTPENRTQETLSIKLSKDYSNCQNDLVYRDYGTGVHLTSHSSLTINQLDLELQNDETAIICAVNLENYEVIKISDYKPNQYIVFKPITDGVYQLIAVISSGELRDLTPNAFAATALTQEDTTAGFILLQ
jgi:hypothetical protein